MPSWTSGGTQSKNVLVSSYCCAVSRTITNDVITPILSTRTGWQATGGTNQQEGSANPKLLRSSLQYLCYGSWRTGVTDEVSEKNSTRGRLYMVGVPSHEKADLSCSNLLLFPRLAQAQTSAMKYLPVIALLFAGCSSPTAPSPTVTTPPVSVTPPVVTPPVIMPTRNPLLDDPRFDLRFYRMFVNNAFDSPNLLQPLRRQSHAPKIYLRTVDDAGSPMDALTLNQTQAALESVTGQLTGAFGIAGLERGTETRQGQPGWITVRWSDRPDEVSATRSVCGRAAVGGDLLTLYPKSRFCRCAGGPAVTLTTIKHEMGHALGYWHTDSREDLMYQSYSACDQQPSAREIFHARLAYTQAIGSYDPR